MLNYVALFTRAWIEIKVGKEDCRTQAVALFTRAWIEIILVNLIIKPVLSRPLHEGVD